MRSVTGRLLLRAKGEHSRFRTRKLSCDIVANPDGHSATNFTKGHSRVSSRVFRDMPSYGRFQSSLPLSPVRDESRYS